MEVFDGDDPEVKARTIADIIEVTSRIRNVAPDKLSEDTKLTGPEWSRIKTDLVTNKLFMVRDQDNDQINGLTIGEVLKRVSPARF